MAGTSPRKDRCYPAASAQDDRQQGLTPATLGLELGKGNVAVGRPGQAWLSA